MSCLLDMATDRLSLRFPMLIRWQGKSGQLVFPGYPTPVVRNIDTGRELVTMRWGAATDGIRLFSIARGCSRELNSARTGIAHDFEQRR